MKSPVCLILLIPAVAGIMSGDQIAIQFSPATEAVTAGDNISTDVNVSGLGLPPAVGAYDLTVSFDPSILSFTGVRFGTLLGDPSLFEALTATSGDSGSVEFADVSLLPSDELNSLQSPDFTLATLSFQAIDSGTATFSLTAGVVDDAFGNKLLEIPEPASGVLIVSGLMVFFLAARSRTKRAALPVPVLTMIALIAIAAIAIKESYATRSDFGVPAEPANHHSFVRDANLAMVARDDVYGGDIANFYLVNNTTIYDIVMQQCFGGGFVDDIQTAGGSHTFASASSWSESAYNKESYPLFGGPLYFLENFTRAWWQAEASGATATRGNYVTAIGGNTAIAQKDRYAPPGTGTIFTTIEHPQYESPDPAGAMVGPNDSRTRRPADLPAGANNYAILVAWSQPETRHAANITRIYNALRTIDAIPFNNIVVLYANQAKNSTIGPFTISGDGAATANFGAVTVDGPNSRANWTNALSGGLFINAAGGLGIRYGVNDRLFIYNTGHGGHGAPVVAGQQNGADSRFVVPLYNGFNTATPADSDVLPTLTNPDGMDVLQISTLTPVDPSVQVSIDGQSFGSLAGYYVTSSVRDLTGFVSSPTATYQINVAHSLLGTSQDSATVDLFFLPSLAIVAALDFSGGDQEFIALPTAHICDIDGNGVIDRNDIALILAARNTPAAPGDPRDADGDGLITVNDARVCSLVCFNSGCAPVH